MKAAMLAVSLLLVLAYGEALQCNHCTGMGCTPIVQTCNPDQNVCASLILSAPSRTSYIRSCMKMDVCNSLRDRSRVDGVCCSQDLCN